MAADTATENWSSRMKGLPPPPPPPQESLMPPVNEPITEYDTVAELIRCSVYAAAEVVQEYMNNTSDLSV